MKITPTVVPIFILIITLSSCNSGSKTPGSDGAEKASLEQIIKAADAISPEVNSINDVFKTLELVNAPYFPVLCNDPYNAQKYLNSKAVAAANLGVFITDIVYHMYGDATEDMYLTFNASQELARYMGLESDFAVALLTELEGGQISRDSLINSFNSLMTESKEYNSSEEQMHVHTAFLTGLYFEKLFISSSLLKQLRDTNNPDQDDLENYKKLLVVFNNQLESIKALTIALEDHKKQLKDIFGYKDTETLMIASIAFGDSLEGVLKEEKISESEELSTIHNLITNIRSGIISAN